MSIKAISAPFILLVLQFYIDILLLFAYCLTFILDQLEDTPTDNAIGVPTTAEKTSAVQDGTISDDGPPVIGTTSSAPTDKPSGSPIPSGEPPALPDEESTMLSASPSPTPNLSSTPAASAAWALPGRRSQHHSRGWTPGELAFLDAFRSATSRNDTDLLRFLRETGALRNASGSSQGRSRDELRIVVPCWDRDDVIGEGSTCPVILNPGLSVSSAVASIIASRAKELVHSAAIGSDGNISRLKRVCHICDHALAMSHSNDEILGNMLLTRARAHSALFTETEDNSSLDQSIDGFQTGLALVSHDAPVRHIVLHLMGILLEKRHELEGRWEDLEQAIEAYSEALALWPRDEDPPLELIHDLGLALRMQCERKRNVVDIERAINLFEESLSLQTHDSQHRPEALGNLAFAFDTRYSMTGRVSDVDHAIRLYQRSLSLTNDDPGTLNNLANALWKRYDRTGDAADVEQAILHLERAISLISNDDPGRTSYLHNLARNRDPRTSLVLSLRSGNHPLRPSTLTNLFGALMRRFRLSENVSDFKRGFGCLTEALSLTPFDHPLRQVVLLNLLLTRSFLLSLETLSTNYLALVLDQCIELVKLTPQQHPDYSMTVAQLVPVFFACYKRGLDTHELLLAIGLDAEPSVEDAALALLERGAKASASPSTHRLGAMCDWINLCRMLNRPPTLEMFTQVFDLLDLSIARGCSLETRHKQLSTDGDILDAKRLVLDAVAFAIEQGMIETAVEFLERGQSILLAQLSRYRSDSPLHTLHSVRPDLATRFHDLSWQVEHATFTEGQPLPGLDANRPLEDPISRSNRLKTDWEDVVQQIRVLDGFCDFLRPTPFSVLRQASAEGPVILVNISEYRSDAIIVTSDRPPLVVPLEFATPDKVQFFVSLFKVAPQSMSNVNAVNGLKAVWDTIVEPVCAELQHTLQLPQNSRIWWCPTSSAVSLPLHAAGLYQLKDDRLSLTKDCLPFLYISSYTSSLDALIRVRQDRSHYSNPPTVLLVGQPNTPNQPKIPQVREEIRLIRKRIPQSVVLMDDRGTHDAVLAALAQHRWVHLACHGHVKSDDPLHSHFALHDGPLSLLEIMQQRLPTAEFAFLSACHSASSNSNVPDEFLHLAAGIQFAGFKSVVGTMWAMAHYAGPPLTDEFYRRMLPKGGTVDHTMAAKALHGATRKLQRDGFPLAVWINFVHWGA